MCWPEVEKRQSVSLMWFVVVGFFIKEADFSGSTVVQNKSGVLYRPATVRSLGRIPQRGEVSGLQSCSLQRQQMSWDHCTRRRRRWRRRRWRRTDISRSSSRSGGTARRRGEGFCSANWGGKHQNLPSSLSAGSPPTPPAAHNTTEEEFGDQNNQDIFSSPIISWVIFQFFSFEHIKQKIHRSFIRSLTEQNRNQLHDHSR